MSTDTVSIVCDRGAWHDGHKPRVLATFARSEEGDPEIPVLHGWRYIRPQPKDPHTIAGARLRRFPTLAKTPALNSPHASRESARWWLDLACPCGWPYVPVPAQRVVPLLDAAHARGDDSVSVSDVFLGHPMRTPRVFTPLEREWRRYFNGVIDMPPIEGRFIDESAGFSEEMGRTEAAIVVMCDGIADRRGRGHPGRRSQILGYFALREGAWDNDIVGRTYFRRGDLPDTLTEDDVWRSLARCDCGRTDLRRFGWDTMQKACDRIHEAGISAVSVETFQHAVQAVRNGR